VAKTRQPKWFIELLHSIKSKRAKTVIDHILKHGYITTEELQVKYGYEHPPRAARDVREKGIPLETFRVKNKEGRTIAAYRFGDPSLVERGKLGGRRIFSKEFKQELIELAGSKCSICLEKFEERYLQIDHRVPYEVSGDPHESEWNNEEYMLLCGSCNRAKSWSCEHCNNWQNTKIKDQCNACYWAHPDSYDHIALRPFRRLDIVWADEEVKDYDYLKGKASEHDEPMPEFVKEVLRKHFKC